jgi:hypothetical protein
MHVKGLEYYNKLEAERSPPMPQIVKGGKYVFGWAVVGPRGEVPVPPEAWTEYNLTASQPAFLMAGSRTSGGFSLVKPAMLQASPIGDVLERHPALARFDIPEGEAMQDGTRLYAWVTLQDGQITVPVETLAHFGVEPGGRLLVIRGSSLGVSFIVRGPVVAEAQRHPTVEVFT